MPIRSAFLVVALLGVLCTASDDRPDFCRGLDCPKYTQESHETFLIRTYEPSTWASTGFRDSSFMGAAMRGAYRIYRYIWGYNEDKTQLDMTTPISVLVNESHAHCDTNCPRRSYLVSYFLPFAYQTDPPKPKSKNVCLVKLDKIDLALIEFGGYPTPQHVWDKRDELHALLKQANYTFDNRTFLVNVYDSPFHWSKRHNEVAVFLCKEQKPEAVWSDGGCDTGVQNLDALIPLAEDEPEPVSKEENDIEREASDAEQEVQAVEEVVGVNVGPSTLEHYPHDVKGAQGIPHTHSSGDPRIDKEAPPEYRSATSGKVAEKELPKHMEQEHAKGKAPEPPSVAIKLTAVKKEEKKPEEL